MTKKCQVRSLSDLALAELANSIVCGISFSLATNLDNDVTITMVEINTYLDNGGATSDIFQDLLRVILSSDYLEANIRYLCLQTLLNSSVHFLVSEIFPFSYYEKILQIIAAQGTGLRSLNLKGIWVKENQMNFMYEIIKNCIHIRKLSIPYIATDDLLKEISEYSVNLRYLDVSGETDITDIGIECLCYGISSECLTVIDIGVMGEENICHTDIALLIINLPNLENLVTYSFVGRSLLYIHDSYNEEFKTKLKYLHDTNTNHKIIDVIVKMCPQLNSIYLDTPESGILIKLMKLTLIKRLKIYKFLCDELIQLLERIGGNLEHLTVIKGRGTFDLNVIATHCPTLRDIDCYIMDQLIYGGGGGGCGYDKKFHHLEGLEMLNSPINSNSLKHFICNAKTLKRLAVDSITFCDNDISSVFLNNNFEYLEDVWFTSAPNLTIHSVEILMENCPELQSIGQLSGWSLTPDDLSLLRGLLKSGNSCIVLSPSIVYDKILGYTTN